MGARYTQYSLDDASVFGFDDTPSRTTPIASVDSGLFFERNTMANNSALFSTMVRCGMTTYFVDVREAKNGKKFISISESQIDTDEKRSRSTVRVFSESFEPFRQAINEAAATAI